MFPAKSIWKELIVPYTLKWDGDRPLFTDLDSVRVEECIERSLCSICGYALGSKKFWIGGQRHIDDHNQWIGDLPMHLKCVEYAIEHCPFLRREESAEDNYPLWIICGIGMDSQGVETRPQKVLWHRRIAKQDENE